MYDYNNDTRTYIGTDETKRTQIDADHLYNQYAQATQPYLNQQTGAVQGAQQNAQDYLTALNNGQASVAQARQNYAVNSAMQGIPAQNGSGVYGMYKAGAGNLGNTLDQSAMGRASETNMGNQMYGATQLGAAGQYGGQADFAMNQLQAAQNAAAQSENARQGNDKASYGQGMQTASSVMGAVGTMAAMASDANSKVIIDNLTKENQALKAQSGQAGQPNDTFHQFYNATAPKPAASNPTDAQLLEQAKLKGAYNGAQNAPFRPDPQKLAAWQAEKQRMADNGERVYWENQRIFNPEIAAEPTGLEKIRQLIAPGTGNQAVPEDVLPAQRGPNHPGQSKGLHASSRDQFIRNYNKPPMVMATDMPGEGPALAATSAAGTPKLAVDPEAYAAEQNDLQNPYAAPQPRAPSPEDMFSQQYQPVGSDARSKVLEGQLAAQSSLNAKLVSQLANRDERIAKLAGQIAPTTGRYLKGPNGEAAFMDDQGVGHTNIRVPAERRSPAFHGAVVDAVGGYDESGRRYMDEHSPTPIQPEEQIPGNFQVGPHGVSNFVDTAGNPNTLRIPERPGTEVGNPYVATSGQPISYDLRLAQPEPIGTDLAESDARAKMIIPGDEYVPSEADRLQDLYGAGPQLPNAGNPIPGDEYVSSDKSVKKTATPRLIHELSKRGINVPGGDPMGGAIDQMMDKTKPHAFKYKDSADMGHVGALPHNRVRPGIVLQDLEKSPLGATLVLNTPKGKMFDVPSMTGANTAMIARLNERLRKLETRGKRHE